VPSRTASVLLDRLEPAWSHSAVQGVRRLTQLRCWVVPGRDSSSSASSGRRVPSLHSSVRLRRVYTCLLFLHTSAGKNPAGSVPGRQEAAVPAAGADIVSLVHSCAVPQTAKDCAGAAVPGLRPGVLYLRSGNGPSRPRPRRPSVCPSRRSLPLLQGALRLPSATLQSPPPLPLPDRLRGHAPLASFVPRPMALADSQTPHLATSTILASARLPAP